MNRPVFFVALIFSLSLIFPAAAAAEEELPDQTAAEASTAASPQVEIIQYGISGRGRPLNVVKLVNLSMEQTHKVLAVFEIHGFEDAYPRDGQILVDIANKLISYFKKYPEKLYGTALYVVPMANPDGLLEGWTNNGPGRCQVSLGVDLNRDFDYYWKRNSSKRNKTLAPFSAPESRALRDLVIHIKPEDVIDVHGWMGTTFGTPSLTQYFDKAIGIKRSKGLGGAPGYFSGWATLHVQRAALVELTRSSTSSTKVINAFVGLCAGSRTIRISVDGQMVDTGTDSPIIKEGVTWLPLRATANILGCRTEWDGKKAAVQGVEKTVIAVPGSNRFLVISSEGGSQESIQTSQAAFIKNGRIYVPLRLISEAFDTKVSWDKNTYTINIKLPVSASSEAEYKD